MVIPDNNDLFSYVTVLEELHEVSTSTELFTKIGEVDLQERKAFGQDPPGLVIRQRHMNNNLEKLSNKDFADLCSDTLPQNGPAACLPGEPQHKVKLKLKEGAQIRSKKPYRIPEAYREDLQNTISKLLEFKLIEPSISKYSNPIFLVPKPDNKDGTKGGMRLVWDGRSVNNAIEFDAYMIPRVEDLMDRIGRLKHLASQNGKEEMWISTLDLRTSFWQLMLDEDSRPLTSFSCTSGQFQWICMPMGLLVSSAEMQRFSESVLKDFANSNAFEYSTGQGQFITAYDSAAVYIDDISVVSFGTRDEHEILLRRVLHRMNVCHLRMQPSKCEFFRHEAAFLGHIVSKDGIVTQHSKLSAIQNWPALTDIKSVTVFVSLCSYYRKFVWRFAEIAQPLTDLMWADGWKTPFSQEVLDVVLDANLVNRATGHPRPVPC